MNLQDSQSWKSIVQKCNSNHVGWSRFQIEMGNAILDADFCIKLLLEQLHSKDIQLQQKDPSKIDIRNNATSDNALNENNVLKINGEVGKQTVVNIQQDEEIELLHMELQYLSKESEIIQSGLMHEIDLLTVKHELQLEELQNKANEYYTFIYHNKFLLHNAIGFEDLFPELLPTAHKRAGSSLFVIDEANETEDMDDLAEEQEEQENGRKLELCLDIVNKQQSCVRQLREMVAKHHNTV